MSVVHEASICNPRHDVTVKFVIEQGVPSLIGIVDSYVFPIVEQVIEQDFNARKLCREWADKLWDAYGFSKEV